MLKFMCRRSRRAPALRARHGPPLPERQARNTKEAPCEPGSRRPPAGPVLRHILPSICSPETWNPEGDPNSSEDHTPAVKKEPLLLPGKRNMCSIHSWCGLQLASPGPVGPTRGKKGAGASWVRGKNGRRMRLNITSLKRAMEHPKSGGWILVW